MTRVETTRLSGSRRDDEMPVEVGRMNKLISIPLSLAIFLKDGSRRPPIAAAGYRSQRGTTIGYVVERETELFFHRITMGSATHQAIRPESTGENSFPRAPFPIVLEAGARA